MSISTREISLSNFIIFLLSLIILFILFMLNQFSLNLSPVDTFKALTNLGGNFPPKFMYSMGTGEQKLKDPLDLDVSSDGRVYIADSGNFQVKVFDTTGRYLFSFGSKGKNPGQFLAPVGIAVGAKSLYVADSTSMRIQEFDLNGNYLKDVLTSAVLKKTGAIRPVGLALDLKGNLYLTDIFSQRVVELSPSGDVLLNIGRSGNQPGQFLYPNSIAVDNAGNIYVSDSNNTRIQVINPQGSVTQTYGPKQKLDVAFGLNRGVEVDRQNRLYVVDTFNNKISVIQPDAEKPQVLFSFGSQSDGPEKLNFPNAIAVYADKVLVADKANNRVVVYSY